MATGGQNEAPGWPKVRFVHERPVDLVSLWVPYLVKVGDFRYLFEGLSLDVYLVLILRGLWVSKEVFLGWPTLTICCI